MREKLDSLDIIKTYCGRLRSERVHNSEEAWRQTVSIPIYPSLDDGQVVRVIEAVKGAVLER